jgi:phage protein D
MESDEISLVFDDIEKIWQKKWYPAMGDTIKVKLGYPGEKLLDCGLFEIDEIELSINPDTLTVKGIATPIRKGLRTKNNQAFEAQTLGDIARFFGDKHGLTLVGDTSQLLTLKLERVTQENETDLGFLAKKAKDYGIIFSVRGDKLVFIEEKALEAKGSIATIDRAGMSSAQFSDKTSEISSAALVAKTNIKKNKLIRFKIENKQPDTKGTIISIS